MAGATSHFFVTIAKTKKLVDGRTDAELPWVRAEDPLRPPEELRDKNYIAALPTHH